MIESRFWNRALGRARRVARTSTKDRKFCWTAVGTVTVLLATVLVPVSGVGAQQQVGPTQVLGPSRGTTAPVAVAGHGQVTLTWGTPTSDGGSPIVGYEYTYSSGPSGSETDKGVWYPIPGSTGSTTSYTVTGLQNGQSYIFKLRAVNAAGHKGNSENAYNANRVILTTVPQAPRGLKATPRDSKITLSWTSPGISDEQSGWTAITGYEYQQKTGDGDWTSWNIVPGSDRDSDDFEVTGLTNGVIYRFRLRAVNVNGAGPGAESEPVVASSTPGRPQEVTATPGDESVTLSWSPSGDGGSPIIGWEYRGSHKNSGIPSDTPWTRVPGSGADTTSYVITGLDNTKKYRFQVRAVNINGAGTPSSSTAVVDPGSVPGPVPNGPPIPEDYWFMQTPGEDFITLQWSGPRDTNDNFIDGGSPLIRYEYQQKTGDGQWGQWITIPGDQTFQTTGVVANLDHVSIKIYKVTGLTAGTPYRFRIRAVNRIGAGPYAESSKDTYPGTVPSAPSEFSGQVHWDEREGLGKVTLSWTPGSDGGSPITGWEYKWNGTSVERLAAKEEWTYLCDSMGETSYLDTDTTTAEECAGLSTVTLPRPPFPDKTSSPDSYPGMIPDNYFVLRAINSFGKGYTSSVIRLKSERLSRAPGAPGWVTLLWYTDDPNNGGKPRIVVPTPYDPAGPPGSSDNYRASRNQLEYSWKVGNGSWGPWRPNGTATFTSFDDMDFKIGETYQIRYRAKNANGPGPSTESPEFVFGGPPLPGGDAFWGLNNDGRRASVVLPELRTDAGTSKVTLSIRAYKRGVSRGDPIAPTETHNLVGTVRWEYSYKVADGDWGEWTFANNGKQFSTGTGSGGEFVVDGLSNGVEHRFRVRAVLGSLPGIALESGPVTPGVAPPAPAGLEAQGGDRQVTLTWTSAGDGGPAITKWQYCDFSTACDTEEEWTDVPRSHAATTSVVVPSLTNGTAYTFRVRAWNAIGAGAAAQTLPVTPGQVPNAPVRALVEAGDAQVTFRVTKPSLPALSDDSVTVRGDRVTGYQVRKKRAGEPYEGWETLGTTVPKTANFKTDRPSAETSAVVRNLENGISYTFQVRAVNTYGPGPHLETSAVVPIGAPTAGSLNVRAGDTEVVLSWAGSASAGSTITGWQYRPRQGDGGYGSWTDIENSGPATTTLTVTGLSNGIGYRFAVRAVTANDQVKGFEFESDTVTPSTTPPQPAEVIAARGDRQVMLSWTAGTPGEPGEPSWASPTTSWQYRMKTGDGAFGTWTNIADSDATTTGHTVTDLINGVPYTFEVRAMNAMGAGAAGSASATPAVVPPAPTLAAEAGDTAVTLSWTPNGNGGSAITGWQSRTDDGEWADLATSDANTVSISDLENGVAYTFEVRATNAVGAGVAASASATPAGTPPAPTVTAGAGDMMVTLSWTSNGDNGSAITGWQVRTSDGEWADLAADSTSHVVSDLINGTAYAFGVRATNAMGDGAVTTESATPAAVPSAPEVTVTGDDGEITLSWTSAGDGGSQITGWHYRMRVGVGDYGEWTMMAADTTGASLTGLDTGTGTVAYIFEVRATNAVGDGAVTTSDPVTPTSAPPVDDDYYSGVVDGPDFCTDRSLGGARLFALDSDDDGTADTCSLPYTRREAIARQNAVVTLANRYPDQYRALVNAACAAEPDGNQPCGGDTLAAPGYAPINDGGPYYSGIITGPGYCANRSLGGPTTYPLDSDGDGVADVCSLPYSRREAIARQKAGDALAAMHLDEFKTALTEECRRLRGTDYGDDPADLAADVCGQ